MDYEWELAIGEEKLTEAELKRLSSLKAPLVRLRGQWVELDAKRLAAGLKMITAGGQMTVGQLLHTGLSTAGRSRWTAGRVGHGRGPTRGAARRSGRAAAGSHPDPGRIHRNPAPLPGTRSGLAGVPRVGRAGRGPGRHDGAGQDDPVAGAAAARPRCRRGGWADVARLPDVAGRQLAARGGEVRARAAGARAPRRRTVPGQGVRRGGGQGRAGHHDVRAGRPRR